MRYDFHDCMQLRAFVGGEARRVIWPIKSCAASGRWLPSTKVLGRGESEYTLDESPPKAMLRIKLERTCNRGQVGQSLMAMASKIL